MSTSSASPALDPFRKDSKRARPFDDDERLLNELDGYMSRGTAKSRLIARSYARKPAPFFPICPSTTVPSCIKAQQKQTLIERSEETGSKPDTEVVTACEKVHLQPLIRPHTDVSLGYCSYLNTCYGEPTFAQSPSLSGGPTPSGRKTLECRYIHFEICPPPPSHIEAANESRLSALTPASLPIHQPVSSTSISFLSQNHPGPLVPIPRSLKNTILDEDDPVLRYPPSWISADVRKFDLSVLGKFDVIMADPPWDIHMSLPYGTMTDDEMRRLPISDLSAPNSLLFLWVTARAMELGRELLTYWGFKRVDEIVWAKTNQVGKLIRTGRTGHWLNHTSEHLLVGLKSLPTPTNPMPNTAYPPWLTHRGLDTDALVSEVRETSRKPDEVYDIIERCCRGGRKIEIFGRKHNTREGWLTVGNQIGGDCVYEPALVSRLRARYPDRINLAQQATTPTPTTTTTTTTTTFNAF